MDQARPEVCTFPRIGENHRRSGSFGSWQVHPSRFLTEGELARVRATAWQRARGRPWRRTRYLEWFAIELGLHTGLRVFEMAALRCGDLLLDGDLSFILVRRGKGGRSRFVRIGPDFVKILRSFMEWKHANHEPVGAEDALLGRNGRPLAKRTLQEMVRRAYRAAGIRGHCTHDLRHTYASHLLRASNWNLRLVQKQLGHADIRTTQVYADILDPDLTQAVARLYRT